MGHQGRELLQGLKSFEKGQIVSAREAVQLVHDGDTVATTGFVRHRFPENIAVALEQRFLESSEKGPGRNREARRGLRWSYPRARAMAGAGTESLRHKELSDPESGPGDWAQLQASPPNPSRKNRPRRIIPGMGSMPSRLPNQNRLVLTAQYLILFSARIGSFSFG